MPLGPGTEFDMVRRMLQRWGPQASGIGSDCAMIEPLAGERLVLSTDSSVEGVHFRREWLEPREIGYRATAAAISDLAAAAARPLGLLLAATIPERWRDSLDAIADGVGEAAGASKTPIIGGDLSAGEQLSLTITVVGSAKAPLTRAGAEPGDVLWVTGLLGGPLTALRALLGGIVPPPAARERFAHPRARVREGRWLAEHGARAAVDLSDGLAADARQLAAASRVALWIDAARVPCMDGVDVRTALASGEEYELLVAVPPDAALDAAEFGRRFGIPITAIGEVRHGPPSVDARVDLPEGHDHFSS